MDTFNIICENKIGNIDVKINTNDSNDKITIWAEISFEGSCEDAFKANKKDLKEVNSYMAHVAKSFSEKGFKTVSKSLFTAKEAISIDKLDENDGTYGAIIELEKEVKKKPTKRKKAPLEAETTLAGETIVIKKNDKGSIRIYKDGKEVQCVVKNKLREIIAEHSLDVKEGTTQGMGNNILKAMA